ncbi:hypothetical protein COY29_01680 [Candidatus Woesebacteria bacterium CG_4_10_14_0_2_um_filter_39_14]|uniref:Uncharacterized protein n=1 Tax=Candidatus Woesebacteria bacterium CG_4_10_14_0_2_um_filter_39_14 TaxID=1975054 RepID=A0A2M7TNI4_9BACT|nr:MAG: hypothetical protein COY29_01680 [Candidatus Woesebacteria bacterium CG_4_10_14_0_2_um_filter_39_14]
MEGLNPKIEEGKKMGRIIQKNGMQKSWKAKLLEGIANGKDIIQIMDELEITPYGFGLLNILAELKADSASRELLERLIEEARLEIGDKCAELFKKEI